MPHRLSYYEKISLKHKTPEEAKRITELFNDNINLANKIAQKYYKTKYWEYDEALQIARLGLWKACLTWDPNKYRLSTLAYNIINRDFIDFDMTQKRQPDILFNLEDNCVTEDISLSDVLVDENVQVEDDYVVSEELKELNLNILYILDEIAQEYDISDSIVKLIYIVYVEASQTKKLNLRLLDFIPKQMIQQVVSSLQSRLKDLYR